MTSPITPEQARELANWAPVPKEAAYVLISLADQVEALTAYNLTRTDELAASVAQCVALTAERDAAVKLAADRLVDSERYQWLRSRVPGGTYRVIGVIYSEGGAGVDAAIDAAMRATS